MAGIAGPWDATTFDNDVATTCHALIERMLVWQDTDGNWVAPFRPSETHVNRTMRKFWRALVVAAPRVTRMTYDEFVVSSPPHKRKLYDHARNSLLLDPFDARKDALLSPFVKSQKENAGKAILVPRGIFPRTPRFNVEIGCYIRPCEGVLYKAVNRVYGDVTVFKGMNAQVQAEHIVRKWNKYTNPVGVGADASRFDRSISVPWLKWAGSVYAKCHYDDKYLLHLLSLQRSNRGSTRCRDGFISFKFEGGRMSGDMNTGLGNTIIMCGIVHSYLSGKVGKFDLVNNGDDCVIILEQEDLPVLDGFPAFCEALGFRMEMEQPITELEQLEFCQSRPVFDGTSWTMCRNPHKASTTDFCAVKTLETARVWHKQLKAVADCGLAMAGGLPVFDAMYRSMARATTAGAVKDAFLARDGLYWLSRDMHREHKTVTQEARISFYRAYGITPQLQEAMETEYDNLYIRFKPPVVFNPACHVGYIEFASAERETTNAW